MVLWQLLETALGSSLIKKGPFPFSFIRLPPVFGSILRKDTGRLLGSLVLALCFMGFNPVGSCSCYLD